MRTSFLSLASLFCFITSDGQSNAAFTGTWSGKLNVGVELRIVFHIKETAGGGLSSTADSPDQSTYGIKCDTTILSEGQLTIEMRAMAVSFSGKLTDDSTIDGAFKQGKEFPLRLTKGLTTRKRNRPQTPQPPFPYKSEDVVYSNRDKSLHYGATITIPPGKGPFPAVVLITGSGRQNRDEEVLEHHPFAVIADALTKKGIIVLRVDDRGVGKSSGSFAGSTTADFADDANASLDYLLSRPETDKSKTGLIGHSEGGLIAPMVADKRKEVSFIVLLAAPAVKLLDMMTEQNVVILASEGRSKAVADAYGVLYKNILTTILNSADNATAITNATNTFNEWVAATPADIVKSLGLGSAKDQQGYVNSQVQALSDKWLKYLMNIDPAPYLQQLHCKVLALNGDKDVQVPSSSNLSAMRANLKKSQVKNYEVKELAGLNHLFQRCVKCTLQEYGDIEETFSPEALQLITDWIDKNVK